MSRTFAWLGIGLIALCAIWMWVALRRHAARKRREEERATAFIAEAVSSMKKGTGTGQKSA